MPQMERHGVVAHEIEFHFQTAFGAAADFHVAADEIALPFKALVNQRLKVTDHRSGASALRLRH